jgi:predicted PurR-regulated permease PerM
MTENSLQRGTRVSPPLYQRLSLIMIGLVALVHALSCLRSIVVPLLFSLLLAILLDPVVKFLSRRGIHRVLGITLAVTVAMLALAGIGYFIATQAAHFSETIPQIKSKVAQMGEDIQHWARHAAKVKPQEMDDAVDKVKKEGMAQGGMLVGKTLTTVGALFGFFFLLPVFTFLIIFYKDLFHNFLAKLFPKNGHEALDDALGQTKSVVQSFLVGRMFETVILAAMNWVGLLVIGVHYALLLAVLGALLNLVPYIGMIVATFITVVVTLALQDVTAALWVFALYCAVQFVDNHFLVPLVVGSRVQINALFSIVVVILGGMLWGIPGMFLSIPITAMLKVVFDRVPGLKPWGYVLGTEDDGKEQDKGPHGK